jgi:hypothetical protein
VVWRLVDRERMMGVGLNSSLREDGSVLDCDKAALMGGAPTDGERGDDSGML